MTDILFIGTGYTGKVLARLATASGAIDRFAGTSRTEETLTMLESLGAEAIHFDLQEDDIALLAPHITPDTWVIYSVPTLHREYEPAANAETPARHVAPVREVLEVASSADARGFIYLSATSVYGDHQGEEVTEESAREPTSPIGKMRADIEDEVLSFQGSIDHLLVARLVGIYGPGRTLAEYIPKGRYKLVDGGKKRTNRIHVEDIAGALLAMIDRAPEGAHAYNVSDGDPRTVREVVDEVCALTDTPYPPEATLEEIIEERGENVAARWKNTYRCSNQKLVEELGWQPRYPNVIVGYRAILGDGGDRT